MEVRKNWQHLRVARFGGLGSHRLVSTTMTYAAVPPNDGVHGPTAHGQRNHTQNDYTDPDGGPQHRHTQTNTQRNTQTNTQNDCKEPNAAATRRAHLNPPTSTPHADVIDDTVTSWFPDGCHGYGDVTEQQQQQPHGGEALCMTPLNVDRH